MYVINNFLILIFYIFLFIYIFYKIYNVILIRKKSCKIEYKKYINTLKEKKIIKILNSLIIFFLHI